MMGFSNMRDGVFASITVHLLFVIFMVFGLPNLFTSRDYSIVIIPVELVTDDQLNAPPPPAAPEPKPEPKPEAAAPPPPPEPKPEPKVVEAPPPPPVEKPKPPKKKEPPKPKPTPLAKAKPQSKPKPPKKPKSFASVLKDLDKLEKKKPAPRVIKESTPKDKDKPSPDQQIAEQASITEIERLKQLIRQQIQPCWSPPVGAAEAEDLAITIFIRVDRQGFVREVRVIDAPAMALNTYVQAAADAARRAVLNPRCQPFELPIKRYDLWKEIRFNFDPREMLG